MSCVAMLWYLYVAIAAATAGLCAFAAAQRNPAVEHALRLVVLWPLRALTIALCDRFPALALDDFPSSADDVLQNAGHLAELLRRDPRNAAIFANLDGPPVRWARESGLNTEPLKDRTTTKLVYYFRRAGAPRDAALVPLRVFVKTSSKRRISLVLRALSAAMIGAPMENQFFDEMDAGRSAAAQRRTWSGLRVPVGAPECMLTRANPWASTSLLVLKTLSDSYVSVPDWQGATYEQTRLIVTRAARLHAANWRPTTAVLPGHKKRGGLSHLGICDLYMGKHPAPCVLPMWTALKRYFDAGCAGRAPRVPLCVSHGDCRPGNMLFRLSYLDNAPRTAATAAASVDAPASPGRKSRSVAGSEQAVDAFFDELPDEALVFTDWEAVGVTVWLWDVMYCCVVGMSVPMRRRLMPSIVDAYLRELCRNGVPPAAIPSRAVVDETLEMLALVLPFYSWTLGEMGCAGTNHGNSDDDVREWTDRVREASLDATTDGPRVAERLGVQPRHVWELREDIRERLKAVA